MTNQRKTERVKAMTFSTAYDLHGNVLLGYLGDLTLKGAMVVGEKPVETDRNIIMGIDFSDIPEIPGGRMVIRSHVAWCRHEEETSYYHTGIEFLEITEQNREYIELVLDRYRFDLDFPS